PATSRWRWPAPLLPTKQTLGLYGFQAIPPENKRPSGDKEPPPWHARKESRSCPSHAKNQAFPVETVLLAPGSTPVLLRLSKRQTTFRGNLSGAAISTQSWRFQQ